MVKRVSLELGGKSANVILEDADIAKAVADGVFKCYLNSGQTCSALTRMLVPRSRARPRSRTSRWPTSAGFAPADPITGSSLLGPLVSAVQHQRVRDYINKGVDEGARLITGGTTPPGGTREGLLRRADDLLRRAYRHDDRPRGDLRTGALDHPLRHGRRGHRHRERLGVRTGRRRVGRAPTRRPSRSRARSVPDSCRDQRWRVQRRWHPLAATSSRASVASAD